MGVSMQQLAALQDPRRLPPKQRAKHITRHRHRKLGPKFGCAEDNEEMDAAVTANGEALYCRNCGLELVRLGA